MHIEEESAVDVITGELAEMGLIPTIIFQLELINISLIDS